MMKATRIFFAVVVLVLLFIGCAEVPLTHRKGLRLIPNSELMTLSLQEYDKVLKKSKLSTDREKVEMIRSVGKRIAKAAEAFLEDSGLEEQIKDYQWEFNLLVSNDVANAWCMPGGKVAVYTGILRYTQNENGLAVVLGHEVAHAIANHGNERMSHALLTTMGGVGLSIALSREPARTHNIFMGVFGIGAAVGFLLPYSRLHESEADRIGLMLMARGGYDPRGAVHFWERMSKEKGARTPEFLSTHPTSRTRIANLKACIAEALPYYQRSLK